MSVKCPDCRVNDAIPTRWERVKSWFAWHLWGEELNNEKSASHTQGFADGYKKAKVDYELGRTHEREVCQHVVGALSDRVKQLEKYDIDHDLLVKVDDVIKQNLSGSVNLGNEPITLPEAKKLREEAILIKNTRLYSIFINTVKQRAIDIGFSKAKNFEEILTGKLMVHNLDIMREIIEVCANLRAD